MEIQPEKTRELKILKVADGIATERIDVVVAEHRLRLYVNGRRFVQLITTPRHLEELVLGHMYSAGLIRSLSDIIQLETESGLHVIRVQIACHRVRPNPMPDSLSASLSAILFNMEQFLGKSEVFIATGAVHSCALLIDNHLLHFMEDIGRHNAFDKTLGAALRTETSLERSVVFTSGRLPSDMLRKIIYSRIPIVVSRSAPTDAAVRLARRYNVTLCGFARGNRVTIYSGRHRINLS